MATWLVAPPGTRIGEPGWRRPWPGLTLAWDVNGGTPPYAVQRDGVLMSTGLPVSEAVAQSLRDGFAAAFDQAEADLDAVARSIDEGLSAYRDVLGGTGPPAVRVVRCRGCGGAWADESGDCACTCTDPSAPGYEDWQADQG